MARLPNKTLKEGIAFSSDAEAVNVVQLSRVRKRDCGHDCIFLNHFGDPLVSNTILREFQRILCKTYERKVANEIVLDNFSVHRLGHTLASNLAMSGANAETLLSVLGWAEVWSMEGCVKLREHSKIRGFAAACERIEQQDEHRCLNRVISPGEFLAESAREAI